MGEPEGVQNPGVRAAVEALGHAWVYIDPAGPTCALSEQEIDFALRVPRNDAVRAALEPGTPRERLLAALAENGPLLLSVEADSAPPEGVLEQAAELRVAVTTAPDGQPALLAFTSGPEVLARRPGDGMIDRPTRDVFDQVRDGGFAGLVLNPGGPWGFVPTDELARL